MNDCICCDESRAKYTALGAPNIEDVYCSLICRVSAMTDDEYKEYVRKILENGANLPSHQALSLAFL